MQRHPSWVLRVQTFDASSWCIAQLLHPHLHTHLLSAYTHHYYHNLQAVASSSYYNYDYNHSYCNAASAVAAVASSSWMEIICKRNRSWFHPIYSLFSLPSSYFLMMTSSLFALNFCFWYSTCNLDKIGGWWGSNLQLQRSIYTCYLFGFILLIIYLLLSLSYSTLE